MSDDFGATEKPSGPKPSRDLAATNSVGGELKKSELDAVQSEFVEKIAGTAPRSGFRQTLPTTSLA